jgi:hypothetical protein
MTWIAAALVHLAIDRTADRDRGSFLARGRSVYAAKAWSRGVNAEAHKLQIAHGPIPSRDPSLCLSGWRCCSWSGPWLSR